MTYLFTQSTSHKALLASALLVLTTSSMANSDISQSDPIPIIYDRILIGNGQQSVEQCHTLQQTIANTQDADELHAAFTSLVQSWKAVEATYMLGSVDVETIDYPIMVDMFHRGNEDVNKALDRALKGDNDPATALYKNSYKTINALEYLLFGVEEPSPRRQTLLTTVSDNVCQRLEDIAQAYQDNIDNVFAEREKTIAYLLNSLVESAYKTREWRVGDAAGLSRKYKDEPDARRQEYFYSHDSLAAIEAILHTHEQMIGAKYEPNFATFAKQQGADEALAQAQQSLVNAQTALANIERGGDAFSAANVELLFEALADLQTDYYQHLLQSLDVVAKILDADGD